MENMAAVRTGLLPADTSNIARCGEASVTSGLLASGRSLPLLIEPVGSEVDLVSWAADNRNFLETKLLDHGGILFRNFRLGAVSEFERFVGAISGKLLDYSYRSTPRTQVSGKIFTSTEYPAYQTIPLHNEMSYTRNWPLKIWFF